VCEFSIPEELLDLDFLGHYKRRIKSVSISIPCIVGPYTGVNATLRLLSNKFRNRAIGGNYAEKLDEPDDRFITYNIPVTAIATSSGQNDSGMFELNFKDERYLPFEGAGLISKWSLELPAFRQFDYNTISDIIMHIKYTACEDESLKISAVNHLNTFINTISDSGPFYRLFSLRHEFSLAYQNLLNNRSTDIEIKRNHFPWLFSNKNIEATFDTVKILKKDGSMDDCDLHLTNFQMNITETVKSFHLSANLNAEMDNDLVIIIKYNAQ
jgi:hypothetical protein